MKNDNENQTGAKTPLFPANVPRQVSPAQAKCSNGCDASGGADSAEIKETSRRPGISWTSPLAIFSVKLTEEDFNDPESGLWLAYYGLFKKKNPEASLHEIIEAYRLHTSSTESRTHELV